MTLHQSAAATLRSWRTDDIGQQALRHAFLSFLEARDDACRRSCRPGHITASTLVLDAARERTLLTLHPRVGRWLQLGGHCEEGDTSLAGTAAREASEESGIGDLRLDPTPLHLDVHPVTCSLGIPTRHLDVRFVAYAPAGARPVRSDESDDLRWWPVGALPSGDGTDASLPVMVELALRRLAT